MMRISPRIRWITRQVKGNRVLDIGFTGAKEPLAHREIRRVLPEAFITGIDLNGEAVFRYRFPNSMVGDGRKLPFAAACFDAVTLFEVIEHFHKDTFTFLEEIRRVIAPGGRLFLTTPSPYSYHRFLHSWLFARRPQEQANVKRYLGVADHQMFWEPLSLVNVLGEYGFQTEVLETTNHRIPLLGRIFPRLAAVDLPFYPFNRLGGYTCIVARTV